MNNTLQGNKEVYFVTARQLIDYVKLLPNLGRKVMNLSQVLDEEILSKTNSNLDDLETPTVYNAKCDLLNDEPKSESELELEDTYGMKEKVLIHKLNETLLLDLQSEVLFLNASIIYYVLGLGVIMIIIIIYDQV
jgi:hypothetical protein